MTGKLESEKVIVEAPLSFTGATKRIWRMTEGKDTVSKIIAGILVVFAWYGVLMWYILFGIFVIPYRMIRRSHRKGRKQELQHREMLAATHKKQ